MADFAKYPELRWLQRYEYAPAALLALLLFRFFDILKPPPIRQLERIPGGAGIMLDDVGAGLFALVLGHLLLNVIRHLH